jgi:Zn-dependent protease with chaperone function
MPFLLLLVLATICLQSSESSWPEPPQFLGASGSALLTWGGIALLLGVLELFTRHLHKGLDAGGERRRQVFRRLGSVRRYFVYALLAFYGVALYVFGWGYTAGTHLLVGRELFILAPMFTALVLSWSRFYGVERKAHEIDASDGETPFLSRWAYVGLQARQNLLLVLPLMVLLLVEEIIMGLFPQFQEDAYVSSVIAAVLVGSIFVSIPWILRLILGLRPLPDGPLRLQLLDTARRLQFRCNDILVWNTRGTVANAMVTGAIPFLRYVVLTDRLITGLEPEEVGAVFGHEVGHVKHHHMAFYLAFILASLAALTWGLGAIRNALPGLLPVTATQAEWLQRLESLAPAVVVAVLAAYIFVVFGYLSRRCERQADIFGCRTASCNSFINALEKVGLLNGIDRERPGWFSSWQHSTIARRVDFLERMRDDPTLEERFQRRVGILKWGVALVLVLILAVLAWSKFGLMDDPPSPPVIRSAAFGRMLRHAQPGLFQQA